MSKTKFVEYAIHGFWAYDVALHIFLKHLIDAAEACDEASTPWLSNAISSWRMACMPDYGLTFGNAIIALVSGDLPEAPIGKI
jgi:hypothetical protein